MATWLRWLSHIMPLYCGAGTMRNIMIRGKGVMRTQIRITGTVVETFAEKGFAAASTSEIAQRAGGRSYLRHYMPAG